MQFIPNQFHVGIGKHLCVLATLLVLCVHGELFSQDKAANVGHCVTVDGVLFAGDGPGRWQPIAAKEKIPTDHLLIALFGAELQSANGAVEILLKGDIGERGAFPIMEGAIVLHDNSSVDADLTLERGIVVLGNRKKQGPVSIQVRMGSAKLAIVLPDAKSRLGIEIYGRHVPGPAKLDDAKSDSPVMHVFFLAIDGDATISNDERTVRLKAPPGDAMLHWDSATRTAETRFLEQLPEMAKPMTMDRKKQFETLCDFTRVLNAKSGTLGQHLDTLAQNASDVNSRKAAVTAMGALDDLARLLAALDNAKYADMRNHAVMVFRQWLGRAPGQSIKLYDYLTTEKKFSANQAKLFLRLCNGIDAEKVREPGTYDLLIQTLDHKKLPIRELARWHLERLAPEGKAFAYDAGADDAHRREAIAAWRRLIPEGGLPPAPTRKDAGK